MEKPIVFPVPTHPHYGFQPSVHTFLPFSPRLSPERNRFILCIVMHFSQFNPFSPPCFNFFSPTNLTPSCFLMYTNTNEFTSFPPFPCFFRLFFILNQKLTQQSGVQVSLSRSPFFPIFFQLIFGNLRIFSFPLFVFCQ